MKRLLVLVLLSLVAACGGTDKPVAPSIEGLQVFTEDPDPRHTTERVTYARTPPAGGAHWPPQAEGTTGWLRCGVYTEPVPNEFAVHSQEHGAVWLTYQPGLDPSALAALADRDYVLVSPYPDQPGRFMASTWGAQLSVDRADDPRLAAFVTAYAGGGQGGEKGADCANGATPAEGFAALEKANG